MRILCVSDQVDPLVYSVRLKERYGDVELVLGAGDLPMEYIGFIASMLNRPVLYVEGNHDAARLVRREDYPSRIRLEGLEEGSGAVDLGFRMRREQGLEILGLPGSLLYNGGPNQFTELGMALGMLKLAPRLLLNRLLRGRGADILLTHAPPRGIHDREDPCHRGFLLFRWLLRALRPRWMVHGHVHLYDLADVRVTETEGTTVVNAFGHWLIDTEAE